MSYIGNTPGVSSQRVVLEEVITGSPKSAFTPVSGYIKGYLDVLVNGVEVDTTDYTAADGVTVTLGTAAAVGDTVKIKTWLPRGLSDGYLKSEADAKFAPLVNGNLILTPNAGSNRVIGFASGTDTTLVLQGGGTSGSGANLELTRDYRAFLDATTSEIRSLDGSTLYAAFTANGVGIGGAAEAGSLLRLYKSTGDAKITLETADAYAAFINYSGASSEASVGFVKSDNSFRFCQAGDVSSAERMRLDMSTGNLSPQGHLIMSASRGIYFGATGDSNGTVGSELFDDYEWGNWPITGASGSGVTITAVNYARYTKIGRMVFIEYDFTFPSSSSGSQSLVTLPFACNDYSSGSVGWSNGSVTVKNHIASSGMYFMNAQGTAGNQHISYQNMSGVRVIGSGAYIAG